MSAPLLGSVEPDGRAAAFVEAAWQYAGLGWALIRADGKKAKGLGWQQTKPEAPGLTSGKWSHWGQRWNLGIVLGSSGLAVLDVDHDDADKAAAELLGELPATPTVRTGRGRLQVYFRDPGGLTKQVRDGFELRVGPHMCVAPPSEHPDTGQAYTWLPGRAPWEVKLAELPETLIDYFAAHENGSARPRAEAIPEIIPIGAIDRTLTSLAGSMRRRGADTNAIHAALVETLKRCEPGHTHTDRDCLRIAESVSRYAPAPTVPVVTRESPPETTEAADDEVFEIAVYSANDLYALPLPQENPELVGPFIRRGRITLLGAMTGHGKTTLGSQMLAAGANGADDFLGFKVQSGLRSLVIDLEQHLEDIQEQLAAVGLADSELVDYAPLPEGLRIDDDDSGHLIELERILAAEPYDIVRIDPFYKLHAADSNKEEHARALVRLTRGWVNRHGFGLLIDTHTRKQIEGGGGFTLDDLFGSSLFSRDPETILGLQLVQEGFSRLHIFKARGRRGEIRTSQVIDLLYSDDKLFTRKPPEEERDVRADLMALGADNRWRTLNDWRAKPGDADADAEAKNYVELRGGIGARSASVKAELLTLQRDGIFEYQEGPPGRSAKAKCWRLRPTDSQAGNPPSQSESVTASEDLGVATDSPSMTASGGGIEGESWHGPSTTDSHPRVSDPDDSEIERLEQLALEAQQEGFDYQPCLRCGVASCDCTAEPAEVLSDLALSRDLKEPRSGGPCPDCGSLYCPRIGSPRCLENQERHRLGF